jgi:hypothetical protein
MKIISVTLLSLLASGFVQAEPPHLIDRQTGKYLGNLNANQYDPAPSKTHTDAMAVNILRTASITPMGSMAAGIAMTVRTILTPLILLQFNPNDLSTGNSTKR